MARKTLNLAWSHKSVRVFCLVVLSSSLHVDAQIPRTPKSISADTLLVAIPTVGVRDTAPLKLTTNRITLPTQQAGSFEPIVVDSFSVSIPAPSGICFDGEAFWIPNYAASSGRERIYKVDYRTRRIVDSITSLSSWTAGIAWDGSSFWTIEYFQTAALARMSPTGILQNRFPAFYTCYPAGIAWDGVNIFYGTNTCGVPQSRTTSMIFKVEPRNGATVDSISPPSGYITGLTYARSSFWYCDFHTQTIYELSTHGQILSSLQSPGEVPFGLAIAKGYLWNLDFSTKKIYQIDIGLAPRIPQDLQVFVRNGCAHLTWSTNSVTNLQQFRIYRGSLPDPLRSLYIGTASGTSFIDCLSLIDTVWYWVTAVDSSGYESRFSSKIAVSIPKNFWLSQNYPNPFNAESKISFAIPRDESVRLEFFNVLGQRVTTLVDEHKTAGEYTLLFNASGLASGTYTYRLTVGDNTISKKLVLLK